VRAIKQSQVKVGEDGEASDETDDEQQMFAFVTKTSLQSSDCFAFELIKGEVERDRGRGGECVHKCCLGDKQRKAYLMHSKVDAIDDSDLIKLKGKKIEREQTQGIDCEEQISGKTSKHKRERDRKRPNEMSDKCPSKTKKER
jgi:hypothetical protein